MKNVLEEIKLIFVIFFFVKTPAPNRFLEKHTKTPPPPPPSVLLHCNPAFTPYFYNENVARKMYYILWCKTNTNFQELLKIKY